MRTPTYTENSDMIAPTITNAMPAREIIGRTGAVLIACFTAPMAKRCSALSHVLVWTVCFAWRAVGGIGVGWQ